MAAGVVALRFRLTVAFWSGYASASFYTGELFRYIIGPTLMFTGGDVLWRSAGRG